MTAVGARVAALFDAARSDAALLQAGLHVEQVAALAYAAAARGALPGAQAATAREFARHEREHAGALETMLQALTVPVREHAGGADLDALAPGLRRASARDALALLAELEEAAIAGHQVMGRRLRALPALRTVAGVMAGDAQHLVVLRDALGRTPLTRVYESGD